MDYKGIRELVNRQLNSFETSKRFLENSIGIDVTNAGHFRVRTDDKTPSCIINKNGSFHDFGSGEHYTDMVSLIFDGYHAFDSLPDTLRWLCAQLNINWEGYREQS